MTDDPGLETAPGAPTVAIATGILGRATETGVRRHMNLLFGGRTVVVAERQEQGFQSARPTFVQFREAGPLGRIETLIGQGVGSLRYGSSGVPFGSVRASLEAFLRVNRAAAILGEFGHIGANLAPIGQAMGLPVFTYFRGFDASKRLRTPRIVRRYKAAMPRLAGIVAVSQFLLDNLAEVGVAHPNSAVIPTGVDVAAFAPGEKDPHLILLVGRIIAKKAPMVSIEAFAKVAGDFPKHRLEIIGDGELRADCEARVRAMGLGGRVVFHGQRDHAFVRDALARASVFLQHSVTDAAGNAEGLPTSIQEAMAAGAVVVSTIHAGIPEAVETGVNGMLVPEHDEAAYAEALRAVLADPARARAFAEAARATALAKFDVTKLHAKLEAMIRAAAPSL